MFWRMFAMLCKTVVENGNVFLYISLTDAGVEVQLMPIVETEEDDEDEFD